MRRVSAKRGNCIMTTHQLIPRNWFKVSWPNTTFLWFDRLPTFPSWLLAIFGCSNTWKGSWKGLDLTHERTYGTRWPSFTQFTKRHSRNASNNGETAGRSVFSHRETTLNGIRVSELQACKCISPGQRLDTFWTGHIHHKHSVNIEASYSGLLVHEVCPLSGISERSQQTSERRCWERSFSDCNIQGSEPVSVTSVLYLFCWMFKKFTIDFCCLSSCCQSILHRPVILDPTCLAP